MSLTSIHSSSGTLSIRSSPFKSIFHFHCRVIRELIYVIPDWSSGFPYFLQFKSEFGNKEFMKRQNDRTLKEELPRSVGARYAAGDQWRNNSRKSEGMEPKQKQYPVVDVTGDRSKVRSCKKQYCIGT